MGGNELIACDTNILMKVFSGNIGGGNAWDNIDNIVVWCASAGFCNSASVKCVILNDHILDITGFKPVVAVAGNVYCGSCGLKIVVFNQNVSACCDQQTSWECFLKCAVFYG